MSTNNLLNLLGALPFLREAFKGVIVIRTVLLKKKKVVPNRNIDPSKKQQRRLELL